MISFNDLRRRLFKIQPFNFNYDLCNLLPHSGYPDWLSDISPDIIEQSREYFTSNSRIKVLLYDLFGLREHIGLLSIHDPVPFEVFYFFWDLYVISVFKILIAVSNSPDLIQSIVF